MLHVPSSTCFDERRRQVVPDHIALPRVGHVRTRGDARRREATQGHTLQLPDLSKFWAAIARSLLLM